MTVKELKEELNKVNETIDVYFSYDMGYAIGKVSNVKIDKEGNVILEE